MEQGILSVEDLIAYLSSLHPRSLSEPLKERLRKMIKYRTIKKKEHVLFGGEICRNLYFIGKGVMRCYYYGESGEDITAWIFCERKAVVGVMSFYTQTTGNEYIHALDDTEVFYISFEEWRAICLEFPEFAYVSLDQTIGYVMFWSMQSLNFRRLNAQQRYDAFMNSDESVLFKIVPSKYLASYLNMSAETLSRLRGDLAGKGANS